MQKLTKYILIFLAVAVVMSCKKSNEYPEIPIITYKEFRQYKYSNGKDSIGVLAFDFTDGDGDIGFKESDTLSPFQKSGDYYYNFVVKYLEKQKGVWKEIVLPFPISSRIPYLTPEGKKKALTGTVEMKLFTRNPTSKYDTIRFDAFIYDRALHKSNVIQSREIVVTK